MALGFSPESSPSALYTFPSPSSTCCPSVLEPDISLFPPYQQADYAGPSIPNFGHLRAACSPCHQSSRTSRNPKSLSPCPGRRRTRTPSHFTWKTTDQSVPAVDLTATSPVELPSRHSVDRLFESLSPEPHCSQVESCTIPVQLANSSQQKVPTMDSQRWSLPSQAQPSSSQISQSRPSKRRKLESAPSERHTPSSSTHPPPEIESIDLTEVEDKSGLVDALSKQREDAVRAQMDRSGSGNDAARSSLTSYKCPVCMDVLEDATTTICGRCLRHNRSTIPFQSTNTICPQVIYFVINASLIHYASGKSGKEMKESASPRENALCVESR